MELPDHATKLVLLRLADSANDENGECWPSLKYIQDKCNMGSKNIVRRALDILESLGLLIIVKRKISGKQNTSNLYKLNIKKILNLGGSNTEPRTNNSFEPINEFKKTMQKESQSALDILAEFGIDGQLANDFVVHRKSFKAPITRTALEGFKREAGLAKMPIQQAIRISIERGWRGFKANWEGVCGNQTTPPKNKFSDDDTSWAEGKTITVRGDFEW